MTKDIIQLILWAVFGLFVTWGIFFAYVGFKSQRKKSRTANAMAVTSFVLGVLWIMLWMSAVIWNAIEIAGA